jgi:hypothetical protein
MNAVEDLIARRRRRAGFAAKDMVGLVRPLDRAGTQVAHHAAGVGNLLRRRENGLAPQKFLGMLFQPNFVSPYVGNVGAEADDAAIRGAPLDDLARRAIGIGAGDRGLGGPVALDPLGNPRLHVLADIGDIAADRMRSQQILVFRARNEKVRRGREIPGCRFVAEHQAVVGIEQHYAGRQMTQRLDQPVAQRDLAMGDVGKNVRPVVPPKFTDEYRHRALLCLALSS